VTLAERPAADRIGWTALLASVVASAVAFWAFPHVVTPRSAFLGAALFRGVWCGLVAGLTLPRARAREVAVVAGISSLVVAVALRAAFRVLGVAHIALAVAIAIGVALAARELAARFSARWVSAGALALVVLGLAWQVGVVPGPFWAAQHRMLAQHMAEPVAETYKFDGDIFLKTMFLMKRGTPYYEAFGEAFTLDKRDFGPPPQTFNYREPWAARLVVLIPGNPGLVAWVLLAALVLAAMVAAFAIARQRLPIGPSLLGPMLLATYYAFPLSTKWYPLVEFWAGAVAVLAIAALLRERWWLAAVLVTLSVAFRELMVYLIPVAWIAWAFYPERRKALPALLGMTFLPAAFLAYHVVSSPGKLGGGQGGAMWLHGGVSALMRTMLFSDRFVAWGKWAYAGVPVLALLGAFFAEDAWRKVLLGSAILIPSVALFAFSTGVWGAYWGAIVQPVLLSTFPLVFAVWLPRMTGAFGHDGRTSGSALIDEDLVSA
jgi:hypothetical protein